MKNVAILVSSCDKYSWAWPIWKQMFQKYWSNCPFSLYFVSNHLTAPLGKTIKVGEVSWSDGMKEALSLIKEDIIIFLLEDYWFTEQVNENGLLDLCSYINLGACDHIRLYVSEGSKKIKRNNFNKSLDILNKEEDYRAALNAGIWKKNIFLELLDSNKDIWTSEHTMTDKSRDKIFCTVKDMKYIIYDINQNMIEKGSLTEAGKQYLKNEGINYE